MTISDKIRASMISSSWVRKMFEEGIKLKAKHGETSVFDFSIGNPNLPPPEEFSATLIEMARNSSLEAHGYTPQTGYPRACEAIAAYLSDEQEVPVTAKEVDVIRGGRGAECHP